MPAVCAPFRGLRRSSKAALYLGCQVSLLSVKGRGAWCPNTSVFLQVLPGRLLEAMLRGSAKGRVFCLTQKEGGRPGTARELSHSWNRFHQEGIYLTRRTSYTREASGNSADRTQGIRSGHHSTCFVVSFQDGQFSASRVGVISRRQLPSRGGFGSPRRAGLGHRLAHGSLSLSGSPQS